jgi:hypothetical protein
VRKKLRISTLEPKVDLEITKRNSDQQKVGSQKNLLQITHRTQGSQESSPALPAQPETPVDGHLAGLLTYASSEPEAPSRDFSPIHAEIRRMGTLPSGMLLRFSAHTVAGQWRILTALPITRWKKTYMRAAG